MISWLKRVFGRFKTKFRRNAGEVYLATGIAGLPATLGIVALITFPLFWPVGALALGSAAVGGLLSRYVAKDHQKAYKTFLEESSRKRYKDYDNLRELYGDLEKSVYESYDAYWRRLKGWIEAYLKGDLDRQLSRQLGNAYKVPCCDPNYWLGLQQKAERFSEEFRDRLVERVYGLKELLSKYQVIPGEKGVWEQKGLLEEIQKYERELERLKSYKPQIAPSYQ